MIFRSPYPDVEIPETALTSFVLQKAKKFGDKPAFIDGLTGCTISYRQLVESIPRVAANLARLGYKKGDVFAILSQNLPEYAIAYHGAALIGGTVTTLNPLSTPIEIANQLNDSGARFLVVSPQLLGAALEAVKTCKIEKIFVFGEAEGATPFSSLLEGSGEAPEISVNPRADVVALPYSSGTTGLPKGVMLTHYNLIANIHQTEAQDLCREDDTLVAFLPFFHLYGQAIFINMGLCKGATTVTLPRFDLETFLTVIQNYGVTTAHIVPPVALLLSQSPSADNYNLSTLKRLFCGAAPLSEGISRACMERFNVAVLQGYGMTETSPVTHSSPPDKVRLDTVGVLIPNTECKIIDIKTGEELGFNQEGELYIRGPQIMKGYLNNPKATAESVDEEGWLHTGDVGLADKDGYFRIVDRLKEFIKYKAYQIAPAELEAALLTHPAVADAAVIPVPDREAGEIPKAFIVKKAETTAEEVMKFTAERVAPYKKIRVVEFIEQIPKSASGKILRRLLIERERAKQGNE